MRTISLWQPWATAIAVGNKLIETRHWSTPYRGRIAIHAAKRWDQAQKDFASIEHTLGRLPKRIPFGAVIATADLVDIRSTDELLATLRVNPIEKIYGNYEPGRFGWILENIIALPEPIPFKGAQGFFNVPDHLLTATGTLSATGKVE